MCSDPTTGKLFNKATANEAQIWYMYIFAKELENKDVVQSLLAIYLQMCLPN